MKKDLIYSKVFKAMLSNLPVIYYCVDESGQILELSGKGSENAEGDMEGRPLFKIFPSIGSKLDMAKKYGEYFFETSSLYDREDIWYLHYLFRLEPENILTGIAIDVSAMKKTHQALLKQGAEKRQLARRMLQVEEDVRHSMASDLHDEIGQSITAINAVASSMLNKKDGEPDYYLNQAGMIADIANDMYEATHDLMYRLRPVVLETLGFEESLQSCIHSSQLQQLGVDVELEVIGDLDSIDDLVKLTIYRIMQEGLTNIGKHAEASKVKLRVERRLGESGDNGPVSDTLDLVITDDGKGFDNNIKTGIGLVNLKERIQALGGVITINSEPGHGTHIHARINMIDHGKTGEEHG